VRFLMFRPHVYRQEKAHAEKPEAHVLMVRVHGDQQKSSSKSTCFKARSAS
jgi:hypothetical protein